jgi:hypothetical protein
VRSARVRTDLEHLRLLSIFYYVLAALNAVFALLPVMHLLIGLALMFGGLAAGKKEALPISFFGGFFAIVGLLAIGLGVTFAALKFYAARFLSERRNWLFCMVVAGVACMSFPMGTALGVFTFIVLCRPSVRALFEAEGADPALLEADELFGDLAGGRPETQAASLLRLAEMLRGPARAAVACYAFRPLESGGVVAHRWGCRVLLGAVPNAIEMMEGTLSAPAEEVLRAVQGRSPRGSGRELWRAWWEETGRPLFENPAAAGDYLVSGCPPDCGTCRLYEESAGLR